LADAAVSALLKKLRMPSVENTKGAIGNCRYSDITVFSFHPVKIITTADLAKKWIYYATKTSRATRR
jgi:hypothetical protein